MIRMMLMFLAVVAAAAVNLGTFAWAAGKTGDGYWTVGDFGLYVLSLVLAGGIILGAFNAIYGNA
jgi:hypothetical protein